MDIGGHIWLGIQAAFSGPALHWLGLAIPVTVLMVAGGFVSGVLVGATPGLAGPMAMAIALPILISVFGNDSTALLPILGFLIGVMKGATVGGAVPAILFNTPGTPDALMTTLDGHPMTRRGQAGRALRVAHFASASGDTLSDIALFVCAPSLAVVVEIYLDLPEKTALILLSLAFIAAVVGRPLARGFIALGLGLLAAFIGTGNDFHPRLTLGEPALSGGFPLAAVILGVLVVGEVFAAIETMHRERATARTATPIRLRAGRLGLRRRVALLPYIGMSAALGAIVGALPGVGSTLAATLGYTTGRKYHEGRGGRPAFGEGAPQGLAATEAANSAVSGANLIPVLSLGIPGNAAAVFLILAMESIYGLNPGPSLFRLPPQGVNPEMVLAFGLFTVMVLANILNWSVGGWLMRCMGALSRIPRPILLPAVLLATLTAIYIQETNMSAMIYTLGFGVLGYLLRRLSISVLPFVIAFILGRNLENTARQAFEATGGDPWFLFASPVSVGLLVAALGVIIVFSRRGATAAAQ